MPYIIPLLLQGRFGIEAKTGSEKINLINHFCKAETECVLENISAEQTWKRNGRFQSLIQITLWVFRILNTRSDQILTQLVFFLFFLFIKCRKSKVKLKVRKSRNDFFKPKFLSLPQHHQNPEIKKDTIIII